MPLFEFHCSSCDTTFEEIVRSSETGEVVCPECGHDHPKRLMSAFATVGGSDSGFASSGSSSCGGSSGFS